MTRAGAFVICVFYLPIKSKSTCPIDIAIEEGIKNTLAIKANIKGCYGTIYSTNTTTIRFLFVPSVNIFVCQLITSFRGTKNKQRIIEMKNVNFSRLRKDDNIFALANI